MSSAIPLKIRQKMAAGLLPCEFTPKTWAGPGTGRPCDACDEIVVPAAVEFEVDLRDGRVLRLHRDCFEVWRQECEELLRQTPS